MIKLCCQKCHTVCKEDELRNIVVEVEGVKSTIVGVKCSKCKDYQSCAVYSRSAEKTSKSKEERLKNGKN